MYYSVTAMNLIQIKQIGSLEENLAGLSDSIYETGQTLLELNQGDQVFRGEKTFTGHAYFLTGVTCGEDVVVAGELDVGGSIHGAGNITTDGIISMGGTEVATTPSSSVPATATSAGTAGSIAYDSSHLYICVATDVWRRVPISTWT